MVHTKILTFTYDAPWEVVVLSYEDKFWNVPNENLPELVECSFSDYQIDRATQVLRFKRVGKFNMKIPNFLKSIVGVEHIILMSETKIDRKNRTLVTVGRNETFRHHVLTDETTTFTPHPEDPKNKTLLTLEGSLAVNLWGVASAIEAAIIPAYIRLTNKGREIERPLVEKLKQLYEGKPVPITRSEMKAQEVSQLTECSLDTVDDRHSLVSQDDGYHGEFR